MKIGLLLLLVAVVLGGLLGTLIGRDPGYLLLAYGDAAIETSLWFGVVVLLGAYLVLRLLVFLLFRFSAGGVSFLEWRRDRKSRTARAQTLQGLVMMEEGQWQDAHRLLSGSAPRAAAPLVNYLNAARAAHELGDEQRRDELLQLAHESTPEAKFAVALAQARMQLDAQRWEQCLATLLQLRAQSPTNAQVLTMLVRVYQELHDPKALTDLLPVIKKRKVLPAEELALLEQQCWIERIAQEPNAAWQELPRSLRVEPVIVAAYARACLTAGDAQAAERALQAALNKHWDPELVALYGETVDADAKRQLVTAQGWLKRRPNDAILLLATGRIALMNKQWEQAREYLEASLRAKPTAEAFGELGRLCNAQGDVAKASECFAQAASGLPQLPLPEPTGG